MNLKKGQRMLRKGKSRYVIFSIAICSDSREHQSSWHCLHAFSTISVTACKNRDMHFVDFHICIYENIITIVHPNRRLVTWSSALTQSPHHPPPLGDKSYPSHNYGEHQRNAAPITTNITSTTTTTTTINVTRMHATAGPANNNRNNNSVTATVTTNTTFPN